MRAALCTVLSLCLSAACSVDAPHYVVFDSAPGSTDAPYDGEPSPDATPQNSFSVGHISKVTVGSAVTTYSISYIIRIVNTGDSPLDLGDTEITNVFADHNGADVSTEWREQTDLLLEPGFAAGGLSPAAQTLIVSSGLVTEPLQDSTDSYLRIDADLPNAGTWLLYNTDITLRIGNARAVIQLQTVASGTGSSTTLSEALRAESAPL